ncbi:glycosyltransferase [Aquabacterium lacunae]|uniref:Glycosyltransferase n=1 Tax=Aquabacterium lacunae TaxID=2528630 RepID=A0A4Q9GV74_9BURK|nr:glycosyltransferase family 4 protein [Aquabacterium lacunae]TBO28310.1 glycosyltransferase [Aquabacterium lacunae]
MLKVMLFAPHFAEYSLSFAIELAEHCDVCLVLNDENLRNEVAHLHELKLPPRLKVISFPHNRSIKCLVSNALLYLKAYLDFRPDVVHLQEEPKDYLVLALMFMRSKIVLTVHDPKPHAGEDLRKQRFSRYRLYRSYLRLRAGAIIVHGERMRELCSKVALLSKKRIFSAPHGPLGIIIPFQSTAKNVIGRCLFFGRIQEYKGLDFFIKAIEMLNHRGCHVVGVIAGRGPDLARCAKFIDNPNSFVINERYLSSCEVLQEFQLADVVVLPYTEATQSGVAAYALGRGKPIVSTDVGSLSDMVVHGVNGLLCPPRNVEALADAIQKLVEDRSLNEAMSVSSIELARGPMSWATAVDVSKQAYFEVISS